MRRRIALLFGMASLGGMCQPPSGTAPGASDAGRTDAGTSNWQVIETGIRGGQITALAVVAGVGYAGTLSGKVYKNIGGSPWSLAWDSQSDSALAATGAAGSVTAKDASIF